MLNMGLIKRETMYRESELEDKEWKSYLNSIKSSFCPYLRKSSQLGLTKYTEYDLIGLGDWEELSFSYALIHSEILRRNRQKESGTKKILMCENLLFKVGEKDIVQREMFFQWTHWALKTLYTEKGLLFGKFWPEEQIHSIGGDLIPDPPLIFLSIRSTVGDADAKFFDIAPKLMDSHKSATDDNESVFKIEALTEVDLLLNDYLPQVRMGSEVKSLANKIALQKPLKAVIHEYGFQFI